METKASNNQYAQIKGNRVCIFVLCLCLCVCLHVREHVASVCVRASVWVVGGSEMETIWQASLTLCVYFPLLLPWDVVCSTEGNFQGLDEAVLHRCRSSRPPPTTSALHTPYKELEPSYCSRKKKKPSSDLFNSQGVDGSNRLIPQHSILIGHSDSNASCKSNRRLF